MTHIPFRYVLIEGCRVIEHISHVHNRADVPTRNICIKQSRPRKHFCHTDHLARVPPRDVLVEARRPSKKIFHALDLAHVPIRHVRRTSSSTVCYPGGTAFFPRRNLDKTPTYGCAKRTLARERRPLSTSAETSTDDQEKRANDCGSQDTAPHIVSLPRSG